MIYFSSDGHLNHANIIGHCGRDFSDVIEMNEELIRRHNELVKPEDTVYYLGDFSLSEKAVEEYLPRFNGIKILVQGNHDLVFSARPKFRKAIKRYLSYGFSSVQEQMEITLGNRKFLLCHFPYKNSENPEEKYSQWRPIDKGEFLLHGHEHNSKPLWRKRMINVGIDQWNYYPVSETKILDLVAEILEAEQI